MSRAGLRVEVLTPHTAAGPEVELPDMSSGRRAVVVARIRPTSCGFEAAQEAPTEAPALRALTEEHVLDRAVASLRSSPIDVVAFASTSTAYALGYRAEQHLVERVRDGCGVPVVASGASAIEALRRCGPRRVA